MRRGEVVKVRRGVYAPAKAWNELASWQRYLVRVHAVALLHPDVVFCLESAAALLGLPVFGDPVVVHILELSSTDARLVGGIRTHTTAEPRELVQAGGLVMTSATETVVDLARNRHHAIGLAVADAALRADPTLHRAVLVARNEARASSRGRNVARWPLHRATPAAESPLESISRGGIEWLGFPVPELQVEFRSAEQVVDRGDFWWPEYRVVGEADGDVKYDGSLGDPVAALRRRRERDTRLRRGQVRAIAHFGWTEAAAFEPLRDLLLSHGVPRITLEATAELVSLRRTLIPSWKPPAARR